MSERKLPKCGKCGASGVRIYREYGSFRRQETDRCNGCMEGRSKGWMVPCILDDDGEAWGYGSVPEADYGVFLGLPEKSSEHAEWTRKGWSDFPCDKIRFSQGLAPGDVCR